MKKRKLLRNDDVIFQLPGGADINDAIAEAIKLSRKKTRIITFDHSHVTVNVRWDSNPDLIFRDWLRAVKGCIEKDVGPTPKPALTEEEKESITKADASITKV